MARILVLNGPNLNLLGTREPEVYGRKTLQDIRAGLERMLQEAEHSLDFFQSNAEHEIIERIHGATADGAAFILINPGALTHTSVALRDALLGVGIPFIEVHISNVFSREPFRAHSYLSDIAVGIISGLGVQGYELAMQAALTHIAKN